MSATDRQSRLLVAEDWKKIYQSFRNADFQSYDFDNLRRTMINYLRQNYPEDFNDYIESSEYLALIDMIAFLGQNLSFRIDLNARENFLETAERRESILRLARMLAYNPRRNQTANGLLKVETVKTTENIIDSSGLNLSNIVIKWNDASNSNYFEQFIKVFNSALPVANSIGNPLKQSTIADVTTQKYRLNATNTDSAIFPFTKKVEGVTSRFEVVSCDIEGENIIEEPPLPGTSPAFLFRDDGQGAGSNNTGFFMHFRQGKLENGSFNVTNPTSNQSIAIDAVDINDTDVWLYSVDSNGFETDAWTKIASTEGNNIIYNSLLKGIRNVYSVVTRIGDRINLVFSDGVFGNLPSGPFKVYYRTSANAKSIISPNSFGTITIDVPYQSRSGTQETLTLGLRLKYTVNNATTSESNDEIKQNAPATYYTQNRLITGEDYNIGPLAISQDIIKAKATNRISSGISRYFDLKDASGKYSNTSIFADDGILYQEEYLEKDTFTFNTQSDIEGILYNIVEPILSSTNMKNFYYEKFPRTLVADLNSSWVQSTSNTNITTGYFIDTDQLVLTVGSFTANSLRFIEAGSLCRFVAPAGKHFMSDNTIMDGPADHIGAKSYFWSKIISVTGDGTEVDENGNGPIVFGDNIPEGAILDEIIPVFSRTLINDIKVEIIDQAFAYKDFALRYDINERRWTLVLNENINTINEFATGKAGDISGQNLDSSWLLYFKTDGEKYTVTYRNLRYVFESNSEVRFFFDNADRIYDPKTGKVYRDKIDILSINTIPDGLTPFTKDFTWTITDSYRDQEGYVDTKKIEVQFIDTDNDGIIDNPELFNDITGNKDTSIAEKDKIIFQEKYVTSDGVEDYRYFANTDDTIKIVQKESEISPYSQWENPSQIFYLLDEGVFRTLNKELGNTSLNTDYKSFVGRGNLKFHYVHVADTNYRIDPSSSNLIDTYLLTSSYHQSMQGYVKGAVETKPLPPSTDQLYRSYSGQINQIKSISDELIYHPVKYKLLFGAKAKESLQVSFKIVKNPNIVTNDNELKADIIATIDKFFDIENWDFGETFYFQELSAYVMNQLSPKLVSFLIVPKQGSQAFGSLFEIKSEPDEIFMSAATVNDIETIDEITATIIQANGDVITNVNTTNNSTITSSSTTNITSGGGLSY